MRRLSSIQVGDPFAHVIDRKHSGEKSFNPFERERFHGMIRTCHVDMSFLGLSDEKPDKSLDLVRERDGELYPTLASLFLLGHEQIYSLICSGK